MSYGTSSSRDIFNASERPIFVSSDPRIFSRGKTVIIAMGNYAGRLVKSIDLAVSVVKDIG